MYTVQDPRQIIQVIETERRQLLMDTIKRQKKIRFRV